jgi:tetratricopeptide (TPR) repeat protein
MAKKTNPALRLAFLELQMILPLALIGFVASFRSRRDFSLLHLFGASYALATILFYVLSRLRQPIVVPMLVFAGLALQMGWGARKKGRHVRAASGGLLVVATALYLTPQPERHRDADHQMAAAAYFSKGQELEDEGRLEAAYRHYVRAVVLNPDHDLALLRALPLQTPVEDPGAELESLGETVRELAERGDLEEARRRLEQAARQAPGSPLPQHYLANVYYLEGDRLRALRHLEKAVELAPQDELLRENLEALRREISAPLP